jgi:hypothetical protein
VRAFQGRGQPVVSVAIGTEGPAGPGGRVRGPGADPDTAALAAEALRRWWQQVGRLAYPGATELLLHAAPPCLSPEGVVPHSPGSRSAPWCNTAGDTGLVVTVCHLPPGTIRWTTVAHSTLYHVGLTNGMRPPQDHKVLVHLIGNPGAAGTRESATPGARAAATDRGMDPGPTACGSRPVEAIPPALTG